MNLVTYRRSMVSQVMWCALMALSMFAGSQNVFAEAKPNNAVAARRRLPDAAEKALNEANRSATAELKAIENALRQAFSQARDSQRLKAFVSETIGFLPKLRQVHDWAVSPSATEARIGALFRKRIMDEDAVCRFLEKSLNDYCKELDEFDQALLIKLKIDRDTGRTILPRTVIDAVSFKRPIHTAASAAVTAVQRDMYRSAAGLVASEAIGIGVKEAAREFGLMPKRGSGEDFLAGLLIDIGVGIAVDAMTDPTEQMVSGLQKHLVAAEREILDGTAAAPGFIPALKKLADDRAAARRKLVEAEFSK